MTKGCVSKLPREFVRRLASVCAHADMPIVCVQLLVGDGIFPTNKKAGSSNINVALEVNGTMYPSKTTTALQNFNLALGGASWFTERGTSLVRSRFALSVGSRGKGCVAQTLTPESGWQPDAWPTRPMEATFYRLGSVVMLSGRLKGGKAAVIGSVRGLHCLRASVNNLRCSYHLITDRSRARLCFPSLLWLVETLLWLAFWFRMTVRWVSLCHTTLATHEHVVRQIICTNYQGKDYISLDGIAFFAAR